MLPSPITRTDDNYWDALHYRVAIADRLARDLAVAGRGEELDSTITGCCFLRRSAPAGERQDAA